VKELAPTTALRQLQYREDDRQGVGKRNRIALASEYAERYTREILDPVDLGAIVAELPSDSVTALLCVERDPEACHRSLVAARLRAEYGLPVTNLRPGDHRGGSAPPCGANVRTTPSWAKTVR
jgi:uncharacterized protein YeaO (DUF488 family)